MPIQPLGLPFGSKEGLDNYLLGNIREGRDMSLSPNCEQFSGLSRPSLIILEIPIVDQCILPLIGLGATASREGHPVNLS